MRLKLMVVCLLWPLAGAAELGSISAAGAASVAGRAILQPTGPEAPRAAGASLFVGQRKGSLFAPYPVRVPADALATLMAPSEHTDPQTLNAVQRIRHVIGRAESPRAGYDAVQHGARIRPRKPPTQMTVGEIFDWIAATPGQPHAIGRYQFIPDTLRRVVAKTGVRHSDVFTPQVQDRLADVLLADAGFSAFMAGRLSKEKFMDNLAAIWAGLPTSNGRSKYHGVAGNRATVTLAYFRSEIAKIAPS